MTYLLLYYYLNSFCLILTSFFFFFFLIFLGNVLYFFFSPKILSIDDDQLNLLFLLLIFGKKGWHQWLPLLEIYRELYRQLPAKIHRLPIPNHHLCTRLNSNIPWYAIVLINDWIRLSHTRISTILCQPDSTCPKI